jgi:molybdopterin converting factor small subunit
MASLRLPSTLPLVFPGLPREPGPTLRRHINVYVDGSRADLDTALEPGSRVDVIAAISGG